MTDKNGWIEQPGPGSRGYRGGFSEKLLEASFMSDRANASWLQDRSATGQGLWQLWCFQGLPDPGCRGCPRQRNPVKHDLSRPLRKAPELQAVLASSSALSDYQLISDFSSWLAKCLWRTQGERGEDCMRFHRDVFTVVFCKGSQGQLFCRAGQK